MEDKDVVNPPIQEETQLESRKSTTPVWLFLFYLTLLVWTIWNVIRYWD
jgi:hypothetical protein